MSIERTLQTLPNLSVQERDRLRINAERLQAKGTPQQKVDATTLLQAMAGLESARRQALIDRLAPLSVAQRVVEAFRAMPMTETERKLVQVLMDHPGSTSTELSRALGWGGQSWHMHFGTMCFLREAYLWPAPPSNRPGQDFYSGILADLEAGTRWTLKLDVAEAFAAIGITPAPRRT